MIKNWDFQKNFWISGFCLKNFNLATTVPFFTNSKKLEMSKTCFFRCGHIRSISDSKDMNLGKLQEMVSDREAWLAAVHGVSKSRTRLEWPNWTVLAFSRMSYGILSVWHLFIILASLGLCCCLWSFSSCGWAGPTLSCGVWASHCGGFSCCGT